jgi:hypothetical protein
MATKFYVSMAFWKPGTAEPGKHHTHIGTNHSDKGTLTTETGNNIHETGTIHSNQGSTLDRNINQIAVFNPNPHLNIKDQQRNLPIVSKSTTLVNQNLKYCFWLNLIPSSFS